MIQKQTNVRADADKISPYLMPGIEKPKPELKIETLNIQREALSRSLTVAVGTRGKIENDPECIIRMVEQTFGYTRETILKKTRKREIIVARQAWAESLKYYSENFFEHKYSLRVIGGMIGGKDHATVLHCCKVVRDTWSADRFFGYGEKIAKLHVDICTHLLNNIFPESDEN